MPQLLLIAASGTAQRRLLEETAAALEKEGYTAAGKQEGGEWNSLLSDNMTGGLFDEKRFVVVESAFTMGPFPEKLASVVEPQSDVILLLVYESDAKAQPSKFIPKEVLSKCRVVKPVEFPRWPRERQEYISCFCCPPNTLRTICEAQNYAYTVSENALWCNLYGQSELTTKLGKHDLEVSQVTGYPYDGKVMLTFRAVPKKQEMALHLRIPAWCDRATVKVNGEVVDVPVKANTYATLNRVWKKGDVVELDMEMRVKLMESNPLVEETRNQVVVKRGPLVYCLEGMDVADGRRIDDVLIPSTIQFTPTEITIDGSKMIALDGEARLMDEASWDNVLYREVGKADRTVKIRLIPYFAWGNRGKSEMTVWMPLAK